MKAIGCPKIKTKFTTQKSSLSIIFCFVELWTTPIRWVHVLSRVQGGVITSYVTSFNNYNYNNTMVTLRHRYVQRDGKTPAITMSSRMSYRRHSERREYTSSCRPYRPRSRLVLLVVSFN